MSNRDIQNVGSLAFYIFCGMGGMRALRDAERALTPHVGAEAARAMREAADRQLFAWLARNFEDDYRGSRPTKQAAGRTLTSIFQFATKAADSPRPAA